MNLTLQLPDEDLQALKAKASARGVSAEEYALHVLEQDLAPAWRASYLVTGNTKHFPASWLNILVVTSRWFLDDLAAQAAREPA